MSWLHPDVEVRRSAIEGSGLFATRPIPAGTVVARLSGRVVSTAELRQLLDVATDYVDTIGIDDDQHLVLPPGQPIHFGNHSCDPSMWHVDAYTLAARRDLAVGAELTVDYASQTTESAFRMDCRCGAATCRGVITGDDWRHVDFEGHAVPAVLRQSPA
jgi:hypothetical protein